VRRAPGRARMGVLARPRPYRARTRPARLDGPRRRSGAVAVAGSPGRGTASTGLRALVRPRPPRCIAVRGVGGDAPGGAAPSGRSPFRLRQGIVELAVTWVPAARRRQSAGSPPRPGAHPSRGTSRRRDRRARRSPGVYSRPSFSPKHTRPPGHGQCAAAPARLAARAATRSIASGDRVNAQQPARQDEGRGYQISPGRPWT
jgi:hypothetical protein